MCRCSWSSCQYYRAIFRKDGMRTRSMCRRQIIKTVSKFGALQLIHDQRLCGQTTYPVFPKDARGIRDRLLLAIVPCTSYLSTQHFDR
jgi:hypothetical protein